MIDPTAGARRSLLFAPCLALLLALLPEAACATEPAFRYRNAFWRNLHHLLYAQALADPGPARVRRIRLIAEDEARADGLDDHEAVVWADARAFYATRMATRDLLFDEGMVAIGEALSSAAPDAPLIAYDVPDELIRVLNAAAPVYRRHWWPAHHAGNERWRRDLEPLLQRHGAALRDRIPQSLEAPWPAGPVVVDLVHYANPVGAYTTLDPLRVTIATSDARNQDSAALEILFHETAHGMMGPVRTHIARAESQSGRPSSPARRELWHQVQFHLVGQAVAAEVPGHVPYADAVGLWDGPWSRRVRAAIAGELQHRDAGSKSLGASLEALVRRLDSEDASPGGDAPPSQ